MQKICSLIKCLIYITFFISKQVDETKSNDRTVAKSEEKQGTLEKNVKEDAQTVPYESRLAGATESENTTKNYLKEEKQVLKRSSSKLAENLSEIDENSRRAPKEEDDLKSNELKSVKDTVDKTADDSADVEHRAGFLNDKEEITTSHDDNLKSDKQEEKIAPTESTLEANSKVDSDNIETHLKDGGNAMRNTNGESKADDMLDPDDLASANYHNYRRMLAAGTPESIENKSSTDQNVFKTPSTFGAVFNLPVAALRPMNGFSNELGNSINFLNLHCFFQVQVGI